MPWWDGFEWTHARRRLLDSVVEALYPLLLIDIVEIVWSYAHERDGLHVLNGAKLFQLGSDAHVTAVPRFNPFCVGALDGKKADDADLRCYAHPTVLPVFPGANLYSANWCFSKHAVIRDALGGAESFDGHTWSPLPDESLPSTTTSAGRWVTATGSTFLHLSRDGVIQYDAKTRFVRRFDIDSVVWNMLKVSPWILADRNSMKIVVARTYEDKLRVAVLLLSPENCRVDVEKDITYDHIQFGTIGRLLWLDQRPECHQLWCFGMNDGRGVVTIDLDSDEKTTKPNMLCGLIDPMIQFNAPYVHICVAASGFDVFQFQRLNLSNGQWSSFGVLDPETHGTMFFVRSPILFDLFDISLDEFRAIKTRLSPPTSSVGHTIIDLRRATRRESTFGRIVNLIRRMCSSTV